MMLPLAILLIILKLVNCNPRYLSGNALHNFNTRGPDGESYPSDLIQEMYDRGDFSIGPLSRGRSLFGSTMDPDVVRDLLLRSQEEEGHHRGSRQKDIVLHEEAARNIISSDVNVRMKVSREGRNLTEPNESPSQSCNTNAPPAQLCPTKYNTTAPLWGISLTSGKKVTIVQKFPDLLQQVIFHECISDACDIIHGRCRQTFTPYLFLVIPLGPVTLTGQDYVMVESGCACQPKYSQGSPYDYKKDEFLG